MKPKILVTVLMSFYSSWIFSIFPSLSLWSTRRYTQQTLLWRYPADCVVRRQDDNCRDLLSVLKDGLSKVLFRTPLVVWWMESHLPMQEIQDQSLMHEGFTCCRELKPMCHNYWACAQQWRTRATKKKKKNTK